MLTSTLITNAVAKMQENIDKATPEQLASVEATAQIDDFAEYAAYQEAKTWAHASGRIPLPVANDLYFMLGSGPDDFGTRPLAARVVCLKALSEILGMKLHAVGAA